MDLEQLESGLRVLDVPEPPLGFDVDVLVTKVAARQRKRRALLVSAGAACAAIGTAAVLVVVSVFIVPPPLIDKAKPSPITSPHVDLTLQMGLNRQHLAEFVPIVKPDARGVAVEEPTQFSKPGDWDSTETVVTLTEPLSKSSYRLSIEGPIYNTAQGITPDEACQFGFGGPPDSLRDWEMNTGKPRPCQRLTQPDGTPVLLVEWVAALRTGTRRSRGHAHFQRDSLPCGRFDGEPGRRPPQLEHRAGSSVVHRRPGDQARDRPRLHPEVGTRTRPAQAAFTGSSA